MIKVQSLMLAIFSLALSASWNPPVLAQLTKINVGYSAISGDALPAWVAKDAGIFEKNGLDVQLVFFTGGTTAVMALVSADTPIAQLAGPAVINSVMAGSDAALVVGGVTSLNYYLMARPEINPGATQRRLGGDQPLRFIFGFYRPLCSVKDRLESREGCHHCPNRQHHCAGGRRSNRAGASDRGSTSCQHHCSETRNDDPGGSAQARSRLSAYEHRDDEEIYSRTSGHGQTL